MPTLTVVLDEELNQEIEKLRGPVKRSTYIVEVLKWARSHGGLLDYTKPKK